MGGVATGGMTMEEGAMRGLVMVGVTMRGITRDGVAMGGGTVVWVTKGDCSLLGEGGGVGASTLIEVILDDVSTDGILPEGPGVRTKV